jgi:uncharacterized membrane protein
MIEAAPRKFHPLVLIPFAITLAWVLIQFLAPLSLPAGSVKDLSGVVGRVDNANQTAKMNPFARWVYEGGDVNCHQKASRSLFINGNEMPYCSRDLGIFIGMMLGCALGLYIVLDLKVWYIIGGLVPMGIDGVGQLVGLWESTNPVRLLTGALAGFITGIALAFIFYVVEEYLRERRKGRAAKGPDGSAGGGPPGAQRPEGQVGQEKGADERQPDGLEGVHGAEKADDGKQDR